MIQVLETKNGLLLKLKVQPGASADKIVGEHDNGLKVRLKAPPVDGKANTACVRFLADSLGLPKNNIVLVKGDTTTIKIFRIEGISRDVLLDTLRVLLK